MSASPRLLDFAPARRKRARVSIATRHNVMEEVDGWTLPDCPGLALTRTSSGASWWVLTHTPTGCSVPGPTGRLSDMARVATFMASRLDWSALRDDGSITHAELRVAQDAASAAAGMLK